MNNINISTSDRYFSEFKIIEECQFAKDFLKGGAFQ